MNYHEKKIYIFLLIYLIISIIISFGINFIVENSVNNRGDNNPCMKLISNKLYRDLDYGFSKHMGHNMTNKKILDNVNSIKDVNKIFGKINMKDLKLSKKKSFPITIHCFLFSITTYKYSIELNIIKNNKSYIVFGSRDCRVWIYNRIFPFKIMDIYEAP